MNNKEFEDLFYKVPEGVDYADLLEDVDLEDVPEETIQKLTSLLSSDDEFLRYKSSRLLTIWGIREGFDVLTQMFSQGQLEWMISHRLYGYDDTNRIFLYDIVNYWVSRYDLGEEKIARGEIYPYVCKIIEQAETGYYDISKIYRLVSEEHYTEYIPYLKHFLSSIMDKPEENYWRIHDTLKLFLKVEPGYVTQLLKEKQKSLGDFGIEVKGERN